MTPFQLRQAMPYSGEHADVFADPLTTAMRLYEINTPQRQAAFLANVATETESLHLMKEESDGSAYQGRMGNYQPGDGALFIGRGCLQVTGREMYTRCGAALGLSLTESPQLLEDPKWAAMSGAWFWNSHGCNTLADKDKFGSIVHAINGGFNGLDERLQCWLIARKSLGI